MLKPLQTYASDFAWASLAAQQLAGQISVKWPELEGLSVRTRSSPALSTAILAQLTKGNWSSLVHLSIRKHQLSAEDFLHLSQSNCRALEHLIIKDPCLDVEGMAMLAKGNWPLLRKLDIYSSFNLDPVAIVHLSTAKWPLEQLGLSDMPVNTAMAAELAKLRFATLTGMSLRNTGLTAAAVFELTRGEWPNLWFLDFDVNDMDSLALQHLCTMHLTALTRLQLAHTSITQAGAYWLVQASWPSLKYLDLSHNQLDAKAMQHIATGIWPNLQEVRLSANPFHRRGLRYLVWGDWPLLESLYLDLKVFKKHDNVLYLGLDPQEVQKLFNAPKSLYADVHRNAADVGFWLSLNKVLIR